MSHIQVGRVTHINESCHDTRMNGSSHTNEYGRLFSGVEHDKSRNSQKSVLRSWKRVNWHFWEFWNDIWLAPLDMGWLRLVGSLKVWVCFAESSLFCRVLLQKRPMILRSLLIVATPYVTRTLRYVTCTLRVRYAHVWNESCHTWTESCNTDEWVMSRYTCEWVESHIWIGCGHTYESVVSHIRMGRVTHMNGSSHTHE